MKKIQEKVSQYIQKALPYLEQSNNAWLKEHSQIIDRLRSWNWQSDFQEIEKRLIAIYKKVNVDFPIGTIAINWDDYSYSGVTVYFAETNEYIEWIDDDWLDYELDLTSVVNNIFLDINNWPEELGHQTSLFQHLFLGLVELAVINAIESSAFKTLKKADEYLFVSASFHDTEYDIVYESNNPKDHELYFPTDAAPIEIGFKKLSEDSYQLLGNTYKVNTKWIRSDESRSGVIPKEIDLFTEVTELDFKNEYLKQLPDSLFTLTKVTKLNLSYNKLENISKKIAQLTELTNLEIFNNQLATLPNSIGELKKLRVLHAGNNKLSSLPTSIQYLGSLDFLDLHDNKLTELPNLPINITWLSLLKNQFSKLPTSFSDLKNLKTLVLSDNLFTKVPEEIFELLSLENIELGGNHIKELPKELLSLPNLKSIRVYPNLFSVEKRKELQETFGDILFVGYNTDEKSFM